MSQPLQQPSQARTRYPVTIPGQYVHLNTTQGKPLLILLHGYQDSGSSFLRRLFPVPDDRFEILAPNGLFPLPQRSDSGWKEAYAWYFADLAAKRIIIHPEVSAGAIAGLVRELGLEHREKILCGFSQGGYFLPHLARELQSVKRALIVGAGYRPEDFHSFGLRFPISSLHGDADEVIPCEQAKREFAELGAANTGGEFVVVPGMTHSIDEKGREVFLRMLAGEGQ